jgi:transposase InsO family protein
MKPADRILWSWLARLWPEWRETLVIVQPRTVIAWQRRRFRNHWARLCRSGKPGRPFQQRVKSMDIDQIVIAPRSPWQNPFVERLIGSIRRECLDHVIVLNEKHLKRILRSYFRYYHPWRTHQALAMDAPAGRSIQPHDHGRVVETPEVGGLHHHYERRVAA